MLKKKKSKDTSVVDESKFEDYPPDVKAYDIIGQVGKGAFAAVFKAVCKTKNNQEVVVALKVIELEKDDSNEEKDKGQGSTNWEEIQKEAAIMRRMHHPNIVACHASFTVKTELWLVLPYLKGGSCADLMKSMKHFKHGFKDEAIIATILHDVLQGIQYCHNDGRIHRDIKAANILLSASGVAQLSDFGVSGAIIEGGLRKPGRDTFTGSLWWMAPEVLQRENKHSFPADIWSLGITALELAYGKPPHASQRPVKVMLTILQSPAPTVELYEKEENEKGKNDKGAKGDANHDNKKVKWSKDFRKFLALCLQKESEKRANAKDLLKHGWFKNSKEHSYIVDSVLKEAPELKVNKNRPLPLSVQPKLEADDQDNHESIRFSFGTDPKGLSGVIKKQNAETDDTNKNGDANNNNDKNNGNEQNKDNNGNAPNANNGGAAPAKDNDNGKDNGADAANAAPANGGDNAKAKPSRFAVTYDDDEDDQ